MLWNYLDSGNIAFTETHYAIWNGQVWSIYDGHTEECISVARTLEEPCYMTG
jgi:hypothetical protein